MKNIVTHLAKLALLSAALTLTSGAYAQVVLNLTTGWNLLGNSSAAPVDVAATFGNASKITTVWTWNKAASTWAFYAPSMTPSALTAYAQGKGYEVLTSIAPKEGFWVNASAAVALTGPVASGLTVVESDLHQGWNLVGSADNKTASQLNQGLGSSLNAVGKAIVSAWAWDARSAKWKFHAPLLEAQGGTALADYITGKGYLPFSTALSASDGFWLNIGASSPQPGVASGWATSGQPVASAQVVIRGADGRESSGTTLADGSFHVDVTGLTYPALVKVVIPATATGQIATLYGALTAPPSGALAITALTTAVVSGIANGEPDVLFEALGKSGSAATAITSARIASAEQAVREMLLKIASPEFLALALPPSVGFLFAPLRAAITGLEAFLTKISSALTIASLGNAAASAVASLKVGCDVASLAKLLDGSLRPECELTPNRPVSETVAGSLAPLVRARPSDPAARADELSGVDRGNNWKFFEPGVSRDQVIARLRPKLKSKIEDLWSGNQGILFPESFGLNTRTVDELVRSIVDIEWEVLAKRLTVGQVSNITFEYQMLRQRLGNPEPFPILFSPLSRDVVSLASPNGIDSAIPLTPFGPAVKTFARGWLLDGTNRRAGSVAPQITAVNDVLFRMIDTAADFELSTVLSAMQALKKEMDAAVITLPSENAGLAQPARDVASWWLDLTQCQVNNHNVILDSKICSSVEARLWVPAAYNTAYGQEVDRSVRASTETGGQFWDRFLAALATSINESYEQRFDSTFTEEKYGGGVGYSPVVITAELRDTSGGPCCFDSEKYWNADRSALLYRVPGEDVRFEALRIDPSLGESMAGGPALMVAPIVREDFAAPPLSTRSGGRLAGPFEVVNTSPGFFMHDAWVVTLACSGADTACMSRLARSRISGPVDTITSSDYHFGFGVLSGSIASVGGISEFSFPVSVR